MSTLTSRGLEMKPKNENPLYSRFLVTSPAGLAIITHPSTGFLKHPPFSLGLFQKSV